MGFVSQSSLQEHPGCGDAITPALAARVIAAQFPALAAQPVRPLGEGCDSVAFDAAGLVFRFPKRDDVEQQLLLERRVLPVLAATAPVAIPAFRHHGEPSDDFPHHFVGYPRIPGTPAIGLDPTAPPARIAPALGRFLSWLHGTPVDGLASLGVPCVSLAATADELRTDALDDFECVVHAAPDAPHDRWFAYLTRWPSALFASETRVLLHGDFAAEHVLVDPGCGAVTGIIDWSEIAIGDPAIDLAGLFHWGGRRFGSRTIACYQHGADERRFACARYLAACRGVADVRFGMDTGRREYVDAGLRALSLCAV